MKERTRWKAAGLTVGAALVLQVMARCIPGFADWYTDVIYRKMAAAVGGFFSLFPFSAAEIGVYLLVAWLIVYVAYTVVKMFRKGGGAALLRRYCASVSMAAGILLLLFTLFCGINYYRTPFSETEGFPTVSGSTEELEALSRGMIMGVYSPFTIEANYNQDMPMFNIPSTLCHELSHLKGYMREDEANFIAWLACVCSGQPQFQYSGHMLAYTYAMAALWNAGETDAYREIYSQLCRRAREDLLADDAFWESYDGAVAEVSQDLNDVYLKINSQEDGVRSYGRMVDLLLAYRRMDSAWTDTIE